MCQKSKILAAGPWPRGSKKLRGNFPLIIIHAIIRYVFLRYALTQHAEKIITISHWVFQSTDASFFLVVDDSFILVVRTIPTIYRTMKMFHIYQFLSFDKSIIIQGALFVKPLVLFFLTFRRKAEVANNHFHFATHVLLVANRITHKLAVRTNRVNTISVIENKWLSFKFPLGRNIGWKVFHAPQFYGSIIDCDGTETGLRRHCNSDSHSFFGQRTKHRIPLETNTVVIFNKDFKWVSLTNLQTTANFFRNNHTSKVINSANNASCFHFYQFLSFDSPIVS